MATNIPKTSARFETTPVSNISSGATSFSLATGTDIYNKSLSGVYGFSIDEGQSAQEFFIGTVSGTTISSIQSIADASDPINNFVSGLQQTHRKSAVVKITDYPLLAYLREILNGNTSYTLDNILTYTSAPTFTLANQLITKAYADALAIAGSPNASTSVKGIVQEATAAQINSGTATGSTGAILAITPDQLALSNLGLAAAGNNTSIAVGASNKLVTQSGLQYGTEKFHGSTGSANAYVLALTPPLQAYTAGQQFSFLANFTNTGAATLNINALGAMNIVKVVSSTTNTALAAGDIVSGQLVVVEYDGTNFQLISPLANVGMLFSSGQITNNTNVANSSGGTNTDTVVTHGLPLTPKRIKITCQVDAYGQAQHGFWTGYCDFNSSGTAIQTFAWTSTAGTTAFTTNPGISAGGNGAGGAQCGVSISLLSIGATTFTFRISANWAVSGPNTCTVTNIFWETWA